MSWTRRQRRRQPDHRLRRSRRTSGRPRRRRSTVSGDRPTTTNVTGLTNGTTYTFKVTATNANGTEPGIGGLQRGHARCSTIFDFGDAGARSTPATRLRSSSGVKFTVRHLRHRSTASASTRRRPTPAPTSAALWTSDGHAARAGDLHRRDRLGLAAGQLLHPGRRSAPTRPTSPPTWHPTGTTRTPRRASPRRSTTRRCTRWPTARAPTASTRTARRSIVPDQHLQRDATTGSTSSSRPPRRRARSPASTRRAGSGVGDGHAGPRRPAAARRRAYTVTPVHRVDRPDADDGDRLAAGDQRDGHRPDRRARPTRSR